MEKKGFTSFQLLGVYSSSQAPREKWERGQVGTDDLTFATCPELVPLYPRGLSYLCEGFGFDSDKVVHHIAGLPKFSARSVCDEDDVTERLF